MTKKDAKQVIDKLSTPTQIKEYRHIAKADRYILHLTQDEACLVLKCHDYGVKSLTDDDVDLLHSLIGKLKSEIHP